MREENKKNKSDEYREEVVFDEKYNNHSEDRKEILQLLNSSNFSELENKIAEYLEDNPDSKEEKKRAYVKALACAYGADLTREEKISLQKRVKKKLYTDNDFDKSEASYIVWLGIYTSRTERTILREKERLRTTLQNLYDLREKQIIDKVLKSPLTAAVVISGNALKKANILAKRVIKAKGSSFECYMHSLGDAYVNGKKKNNIILDNEKDIDALEVIIKDIFAARGQKVSAVSCVPYPLKGFIGMDKEYIKNSQFRKIGWSHSHGELGVFHSLLDDNTTKINSKHGSGFNFAVRYFEDGKSILSIQLATSCVVNAREDGPYCAIAVSYRPARIVIKDGKFHIKRNLGDTRVFLKKDLPFVLKTEESRIPPPAPIDELDKFVLTHAEMNGLERRLGSEKTSRKQHLLTKDSELGISPWKSGTIIQRLLKSCPGLIKKYNYLVRKGNLGKKWHIN